ncbi:DUF502 domain-containing protein [Salinarimonas ramus]|uniref:Membrane protein n=1 Tax=Salinarimonas ramus TaxID=690164 RepID=A0A917QAS8_9HYPH|nr:DUF502 domain-containing protein [Salinarimonas ramus]GGK40972.1 membrane protein [Salinarimonas ramus]
MSSHSHLRIRRNVLSGLFVVIPLWVTFVAVSFIIDILVATGRPFVLTFARNVRSDYAVFADLLAQGWFQSTLALVVVFVALYVIGGAANAVIGRRILRAVDRLIDYVPLVKTIYSATRTLLNSLQTGNSSGQRVVLIEFPSRDMRALGFVTATFTADDTGEEIAAVYVPTTPNPTSGYVELVPTTRLVYLDWSANDAMSFIVSGGAMTPGRILMNPGKPGDRPIVQPPAPVAPEPTPAPASAPAPVRDPVDAAS